MIYVLLERQIAEGMETTYDSASRHTLYSAYKAQGFINGETLRDLQRPNHRFLISKWRSELDWKRWYGSEERREAMNRINLTLVEAEKVTLLEHSFYSFV